MRSAGAQTAARALVLPYGGGQGIEEQRRATLGKMKNAAMGGGAGAARRLHRAVRGHAWAAPAARLRCVWRRQGCTPWDGGARRGSRPLAAVPKRGATMPHRELTSGNGWLWTAACDVERRCGNSEAAARRRAPPLPPARPSPPAREIPGPAPQPAAPAPGLRPRPAGGTHGGLARSGARPWPRPPNQCPRATPRPPPRPPCGPSATPARGCVCPAARAHHSRARFAKNMFPSASGAVRREALLRPGHRLFAVTPPCAAPPHTRIVAATM
ncbi:hypothetical protein BDY21DRAFT_398132 [Lineolata rhizophorae]|uniref:Uncharacterized protein n=1 Tax=Lineolata rhizophorae TaxID=578093 RepID=A0A6A6PCD6_9PEZI|nr:hypothetical protein BDY21DRAFT_398132 [Lineolata rhizophorae]